MCVQRNRVQLNPVRDFVTRDNAEWLIEKNGDLSPLDARAARLDTKLRRAASCNRVSRQPGAVHEQQPHQRLRKSAWRSGAGAGGRAS
jgi:hypothetical protein